MQNFKGAIFDMDGTLLDSMPVWKRLTQRYLAQFNVHITDADYAVCEGFSQPQVAEYFLKRYPNLPLTQQQMLDGMDEMITSRYETIARPKDGVIDFLEGLRARGIKMAIATLTARRHAEKALIDRDMYVGRLEFLEQQNKMGTAKMGPLIFSMALPAMISMIINALYNIVDSIFVAKYSQDALAAVSLVYPLQMLVVAIGVGTGVGVNSLIARRLGKAPEARGLGGRARRCAGGCWRHRVLHPRMGIFGCIRRRIRCERGGFGLRYPVFAPCGRHEYFCYDLDDVREDPAVRRQHDHPDVSGV